MLVPSLTQKGISVEHVFVRQPAPYLEVSHRDEEFPANGIELAREVGKLDLRISIIDHS